MSIRGIRNHTEELRGQIVNLEQEINNHDTNLLTKLNELNTYEKEYNNQQQRLNQVQETLDHYKQDEKEANERYKSVETNLNVIKNELDKKRNDVQVLTNNKNDLYRRTILLQDDMDRYKKALVSVDGRLQVCISISTVFMR